MVYGFAMEKTTLYLPDDLQRALRDASRRTKRPQAELVREALRAYFSGERPRPSSMGIASDSRVTARDSEEWLRRAWRRE